jgi:uncharacterized protein
LDGAADTPHLPRRATIDGYGEGGFSFAGMSHRGSLLCLPDGIWASAVTSFEEIDESALAPVFARAGDVTHCLIGAGARGAILPADLRRRFQDSGISVECMPTGVAISTYNILVDERRPVAALLVAVA